MIPILIAMGGDFGMFSILYMLAVVGYYAFACVSFFETGKLAGTIRSFAVSLLAYFVYYRIIAAATIALVVAKLG